MRGRILCLCSTYRMSSTSVCETHWCAYALFLSRRMLFCARKHSVSQMTRAVKAALAHVAKRPYILVHGSTLARRHLLSKQYLRVASDRILCARKHLCSKARTVLAVLYVRHKRRHFSSEGLVQTALVHKGNQGHTRCLFMFNVTWTNPAS